MPSSFVLLSLLLILSCSPHLSPLIYMCRYLLPAEAQAAGAAGYIPHGNGAGGVCGFVGVLVQDITSHDEEGT